MSQPFVPDHPARRRPTPRPGSERRTRGEQPRARRRVVRDARKVARTDHHLAGEAAGRSDGSPGGTSDHRRLATTRVPATMYSSKTSAHHQRVAACYLLNFTFPSHGNNVSALANSKA